jgi:hypothetical protein
MSEPKHVITVRSQNKYHKSSTSFLETSKKMENVPNNAFKNSEDIEVREQLSEEKYNTE